MNGEHKHYERQSALAAVGQLTEAELHDLEHHAVTCIACRNHLSDMAKISRICFLLYASKARKRVPEGLQERFIQRAAQAGIAIKARDTGNLYYGSLRLAAAAFLLCLVASFSWKTYLVRNTSSQPRMNSARGSIQAGGAKEAIPSPFWDQPIAGSMKVTSPSPGRGARHVLPTTTRKFKGSTVPSAPNLEPLTTQHPRFLVPQGMLPKSSQTPAMLFGAPRFASTRPLLPDAGLLTCIQYISDCRSSDRSFRMDPNLLSFANLDAPGSPIAGTSRSAQGFPAPVFALRFTRSWQHVN